MKAPNQSITAYNKTLKKRRRDIVLVTLLSGPKTCHEVGEELKRLAGVTIRRNRAIGDFDMAANAVIRSLITHGLAQRKFGIVTLTENGVEVATGLPLPDANSGQDSE